MKNNLLIGAISGNYSVDKIKTWVETSDFGQKRVIILFNAQDNKELAKYLEDNNIEIIYPTFDFWGNKKTWFEHHTAKANITTTYDLIHNTRFMYIDRYLAENSNIEKVLVTDVSDVKFQRDPFKDIPDDKLLATGEVIKYGEEEWNFNHLRYNIGLSAYEFRDDEVLNVGVFGGPAKLVRDISRDIYLLSVGKVRVADQTSYNYLVRTHYKDKTKLTTLKHGYAIHLQVIVDGKVPDFDYDRIKNYAIVHQYDRIK